MNAGKYLLAAMLSAMSVEAQQGKPVISTPAPSEMPPAPAVQAAPAIVAAPTDTARYILSPEDVVQVMVFKEPSFSGTVPIRPDGMITLSLIGDIPAAGMTPMQLSNDIAVRLKKFVQDPNVTVTVTGVRPKQVYLLGEVSHIGPVALTENMSVLQVIAAAGGLSPYAKSKNIYILRGQPGHQTKIPFNYKKALKEGNEQGVVLLPGDTIVIP